jgi:hypothetical protein
MFRRIIKSLFNKEAPKAVDETAEYYYIVNEIITDGGKIHRVIADEFRAPSLLQCKKDAEEFYNNKEKRINYWMMLGIYPIEPHQKSELNITLVELQYDLMNEYVVKSNSTPLSTHDLYYERSILSKDSSDKIVPTV